MGRRWPPGNPGRRRFLLTAALDNAIERIAGTRCERPRAAGDGPGAVDNGRGATNKGGGFEVKGILILLTVGSKEAHTQAEVEGQFLSDAPIVLEVGLKNLVAVVVLNGGVPLLIAGDISHQQVR